MFDTYIILHMHIYKYIHICMYIYICMYMYMSICIHIRINVVSIKFLRIYTYIFIYIQRSPGLATTNILL